MIRPIPPLPVSMCEGMPLSGGVQTCVSTPANSSLIIAEAGNSPSSQSVCGSSTANEINHVRLFESADYDAVATIHSLTYPELPQSGREMRFQDETRDARCVLHRWVLEAGGRPVGYSEFTQSSETYRPCSYKVKIGLLPEYQGDPSLLEALFQPVLDAFRHHRGVSMGCILKEESTHLADLLRSHGFEPGMRFMVNLLGLREGSMDSSAMSLPAPPGISIVSLSELRSDPLAHRKLFELDQAIRRDAPHPEEAAMRFDYFDRSVMGHPGVLPDGYFVALEGQDYVGLCSLARRDGNQMAYVMLTGVLASHRKRGIALAMKAASLKYAYEAGFQSVYTTNEEGNRRIIELNHRFGFKPIGAWICWSKSL